MKIKAKHQKNIMKSSAGEENKSELCKNPDASECSELKRKFAIKHINSLFCASYLTPIVIALALTAYFHHAGEHRSREIQISFERFVANELLKHTEYNNNKNNERLNG